MAELLDVIELTLDIPEQGLYAGVQGTIVECHSDAVYAVEFANEYGETLALLPLRQQQFMVVWRAKTGDWVPLAERVAALVMVLPEDTRQEALDFVRFLYERRQRSQTNPFLPGVADDSTALPQPPERGASGARL